MKSENKLSTALIVACGLLLCVSLNSCGPASKLRRAEKLIKKAELQGAVWKTDTVFKEIPVFIRETHLDSIFVAKQGDTVVLTKDRLQVKYVRLQGDTVFIDAECMADTISLWTSQIPLV